MTYQIETHVAKQLQDFFNKFDFIDKVVVFGSRARHDANPKSDIDLCIYSLEMTSKEFTKLKIELDELPILYKMDVVHFENSNDALKENILRDEKLFFIKILPFNNFFKNTSPKPYQIEKKDYLESGKYPVVDQGKKFIVGYSNNDEKLFQLESPIIIFGDHTRIIKYVDFDFIIGADGTKILLPYDNSINTKYAYYQLLHTKIENLGYSRHYKLLKEKTFQKPTLTKQKQIAKTLDKAMELIELRKESIKKLDVLSKSIFIDMFGDPVSNPNKIKVEKIKNITDIKTGKTPSRKEALYWDNGTELWATTTEVNKKYIYDTDEKITKFAITKNNLTVYPKHTILMAMYGQGKTRGKVAELMIESTINQAFCAILPSEKYNTKYLIVLLDILYEELRSLGRGGNQENLNLDIVKNFEVMLPSIKMQEEFSNKIKKIEQQKALYEEQLTKLQENFDALLAQSFQA